MADSHKIAITILAAGESSRMHELKQLLPWGDTTLLGNAINVAGECEADIIYVVLGAKAAEVQARNEGIGAEWVLNKTWEEGMGSSIACAMNHILISGKKFDGVLFMLCDQPFISAEHLNRIIDIFRNSDKGIIGTTHANSIGVPVLFHNKYFEELSKLEGKTGAKKLISSNPDDVIQLFAEGMGIDLDTKEEYEQALKSIT
ncbi:nucleotidyltransferase family protein [Maribacter sp. HTCC2170]|uniref:nucleotidyltransferase family protein n=1 Tax=Maribacter sp. (strain HTCC2170 / KCCM 42371) TaxID=313603 RepID=UPI00006AFD28|nr:nucleotidyltransferase family protein [Maribacter sp. HTCC2170]